MHTERILSELLYSQEYCRQHVLSECCAVGPPTTPSPLFTAGQHQQREQLTRFL